MDHSKQDELRQWVAHETASLDPPESWQPDTAAALHRLHERMRANLWRPVWPRRWAMAAACLIAVGLLFSAGRMAAQLWQMLTVHRVAFIAVRSWPDDVPSPAVNVIGTPLPPIPARDAADAQWRVHYEPRLPHAGVLNGSPRLSTTFSVAGGTVVHTADLEAGLRKVGITDQTVPAAWDGAQLALRSSALVIAEWPDAILVQSLPLTLTAPPGFDFSAYATLILRILGVAPDEARRLAERTGTVPPWLAPLDGDRLRSRGKLEEINLNSAPATLYEENSGRITIVWMMPDRVYLLTGSLSRDLMIATANAVE